VCAWVCGYAHLVLAPYEDPTSLWADNCTCMHARTHTRAHTYIHTYVHTHTHTQMEVGGELHTLTALPPGKQPLVPIG
jgi:hypothetical protein